MEKNDLRDRLAALSPEQRKLLDARLKDRRPATVAAADRLTRRTETGPATLSYAQERLWFLDQFAPGNSAYHVVPAIQLRGRLDVMALERSLREIVRRHDALRTSFPAIDGRPMQVVSPEGALPFVVHDLSKVDDHQREARAKEVAREEAVKPFSLEHGPLIRTALLKLEAERHVLIIATHHIVSDGWSRRVFLKELVQVYAAFVEKKPSPLGELPIQYADYAVWQRRMLESGPLAESLAYWRQHLKGAPQVLELPSDRPRPRVKMAYGERQAVVFSPRLSDALRSLSKKHGATVFMTALAGYKTVLHRYTGATDICVGTPTVGRDRLELEGLVGFFVNTLVLRTDLSGDPSFAELLRRVRETALGSYDRQDTPFERVVEACQPERSLAHTPLFQVAFDLQNPPPPPLDAPGLEVGSWTPAGGRGDLDVFLSILDTKTSKFDLLVSMMDTSRGLMGLAEYSTDLFDRATITRMLAHFGNLLEGAARAPETRLSELPLLDEAERKLVTSGWNQTLRERDTPLLLHQLITDQVKRTPDGVALRFEQQSLGYRELEARSNQLARCLQERGIGPESLVAVAMERSFDLIISLLAILKSGAAYVPIDPGYPADRIAYMLSDAGAGLLLSTSSLVTALPVGGTRLFAIDRETVAIAAMSDAAVTSTVQPDNLAYVIYTSGSTGRPKGAMNTHRGIVNRLLWMQETYRLDASDRVLQKTPVSFDVSVWELFWPLMTGATEVIAKPEGHKDPAYLVDLIATEKVTTCHFVPSMLAVFLEEESLPRAGGLQRIVTSGEALGFELKEKTFQRLPETRLHNLYGPTEAAVDVTFHECHPEPRGHTVPIGKPIANTRILILDRRQTPTPIGVPGELHIGGLNLGRGYLGRPELTAEKWVPDPLATELGARLYKTGDIARWRADGTIEYIGRVDHQVKVRGFRIELGEIESVLATHPEVRECVVITRDYGPGDVRIVAYVVAKNAAPTAESLKEHVQTTVPEYMVPWAFVTLDAIPLNPSGKVDRAALPAPEVRASGGDETRRPLEERMARIWSEVLGVANIGVRDDFFTLGGHSLLATQVISRIRKDLLVELPVRSLFETPTVAGLAAAVAAIREPVEDAVARIWAEVLGVARVGRGDSFFELGGHSLLATQVVSRLRKDLQIELPVRALFENPTVEALSLTIEATRREQMGVSDLEIMPHERGERVPLSFSQARLWFLEQLQGKSPAFNIPAGLRLVGKLDVEALRKSLEEIFHRHETLRTGFADLRGKPYQIIHPPTRLELPRTDITNVPDDRLEDELERISWEEALTAFDLAEPQLIRVRLVRARENDHLLLITVHHIVFDGWSMLVFYDELSALYAAFCRGKRSPLTPVPLQYVDYAYWQNQWMRGGVLERQLEFWKNELKDSPAPVDLPADRPRPPVPSLAGISEVFDFPLELLTGLRGLSREASASLFMTLHAAIAVLLYRYTGQGDVAVGSFIANRNRVEVEKIIGFFVNTLVIRSRLDGALTFREVLLRTRETALGAFSNQDLPFEKLIEVLHPERDPSRTPFFQHVLVLQNHNDPQPVVDLEGLDFRFPNRHGNTAHFDWVMNLTEVADGLHGDLRYATDLFDAATMARLVGHFRALLEAAVRNPDQPIDQLEMLPLSERQQLTGEWSGMPLANPRSACVHELIEGQAKATPDAIAVVCGDRRLTYAELDQQANQLANFLRTHDVGTEVRVGICVERSVEMIVAVLGVLKSGGAYVPLDPAYPEDRLRFMLEDSDISVLITERSLETYLASSSQRIQIDDPNAAWRSAPDTKPASGVTPIHLAYTIYTSGSTGRPKGVMVTHASLVNSYLFWEQDYRLKEVNSHLQMASFSFDVFSGDFVRALCSGAKLVVVPQETLLQASELLALMKREAVNCAEFVPAVIRNLVQHLDETGERLDFMRVFCVGSDVWNVAEYRHIRGLAGPSTRLINSFGVTEATIDSSYLETLPEGLSAGATVPIGKPFPGAKIYIVDRGGRPTPIGVAGELCIGGASVARGYHRRPELTAQKFVPDPFSDEPGTRLYRTGDLARFRADGNIDFLGRIDNQVKIRGFRVELGEIEAALESHAFIHQAVVAAVDDGISKRLVGYIRVSDEVGVPALRSYLKDRLPDYMVPSLFMTLGSFPLTPNGKVDRRALPSPDGVRPELDGFQAPRDPVEEVIAAIWTEVLGVEKVGVDDDFFDLGGHSLLATQVAARVRDSLEVELPLRTLFQEPTVARLARSLASNDAELARLTETARLVLEVAAMSDEDVKREMAE